MSDFQLDTSGFVVLPASRAPGASFAYDRPIEWSDLTPFQQGAVESALKSQEWCPMNDDLYGFSSLAPATLARIMADCEWKMRVVGPPILDERGVDVFWTIKRGADFWAARQAGEQGDHFPPLALYLADDGLIYIKKDQ